MAATFCTIPDCEFAALSDRAHMTAHVRAGIATKLTYAQIGLLPTRADLLDQPMRAQFAALVAAGKPVIFMPNSYKDCNERATAHGGAITYRYRVYAYGVLPCGSKTCVILDNIDVFCDVLTDPQIVNGAGATAQQRAPVKDTIRALMFDENIQYKSIEDVQLYRMRGFQQNTATFSRVHFNDTYARDKFIALIKNLNKQRADAGLPALETASDDPAQNYFRKLARETPLTTADWCLVRKYNVLTGTNAINGCSHTLVCDLADYAAVTPQQREKFMAKESPIATLIERDPTTILQWDIETYRTVQNGTIPTPDDTDWVIFCVCAGYFYHWSDTPLCAVAIVDSECDCDGRIGLLVQCNGQRELLAAWVELLARLQPDILSAFNGGKFDWPLMRAALRRAGLLQTALERWANAPHSQKQSERYAFRSPEIKISAEANHKIDCALSIPGWLDIDVLPIFLRLYPRAEVKKAASLNYFLESNGLSAKEDMPYKRMFKIYERALKLKGVTQCHCCGGANAGANASDNASANTLDPNCATCNLFVTELDNIPVVANGTTAAPADTEYTHTRRPDCAQCCWHRRERNRAELADVAYYCYVDCLRPQQLCIKRVIIYDARELSNMTFVSLYDSIFYANGMKVCNVVGAYCFMHKIAFTNQRPDRDDADKDHYPGAFVIPPTLGLHADNMVRAYRPDGTYEEFRGRPTTGMDFNSLYPSLMMTYNLSFDRIVYDAATADRLRALGYKLHQIGPFQFERGAKGGGDKRTTTGWVVRHNGVYAGSAGVSTNSTNSTDNRPRIIDHYEKRIKYTGTHNGAVETVMFIDSPTPSQAEQLTQMTNPRREVEYKPVLGRAALPGESMGVFGSVVKEIFDKRKPIKAEFVALEKAIERAKLEKLASVDYKGEQCTLAELIFRKNKVDSKQKALKVLANTFYGESGNFRSPMYELLVAAGITLAGQFNLKLVAAFVQSKGYRVHYGDTDSVYVSCPDAMFAECDAAYERALSEIAHSEYDSDDGARRARLDARIAWWTAQVAITMKQMDILREEISDMLIQNNDTNFLNMAYEEVGYPTVLCGKKKYFMIPHIEKINFYPDKLFIRGIDIVKQGQAPVNVKLAMELMRAVLSPENELTLLDLAEQQLRKFHADAHAPELFAQKAKYNPDKRNVPVHTFVERQRAVWAATADPRLRALYEPPEPGDKFDYVVCKKAAKFTLRGTKIELKKGDKMEYLRVFRAASAAADIEPLQIDTEHYVTSSLAGILARFITYHEKFMPTIASGAADRVNAPAATEFTREQWDAIDDARSKAAKDWILALSKSISNGATDLREVGRSMQKNYREAKKYIDQYSVTLAGLYGNQVLESVGAGQDARPVDTLIAAAVQPAEFRAQAEDFVAQMEERGVSPFALAQVYNSAREASIARLRIMLADAREQRAKQELYALLPAVRKILRQRDEKFGDAVLNLQNGIIGGADAIIDKQMNALNNTNLVLTAAANVSPEDADKLRQFVALYTTCVACERVKAGVLAIRDAIDTARGIDNIPPPNRATVAASLRNTPPINIGSGKYDFK